MRITRTKVTRLGHVITKVQGEEFAEHTVRFDPLVPDHEIRETLLALDRNYTCYERHIGTCEAHYTSVRIERLSTVTVATILFRHVC